MSGSANIPHPHNEPVLTYAPGTAERAALKGALSAMGGEQPDIPAVVGGREIRSGVTTDVISPHCHQRVLARLHHADPATIDAAVASAVDAQRDWAHWRFEDRAAVFLKAADLLGHDVSAADQRRDHARPEQDRVSGRDRQRLRADRLPPLQRPLRRADLPGAARFRAGRVEPDGSPAARRLRLRDHAVQLHRDRRQPAHGAGAHGQHGGVEAGRTAPR